MGIQPWNDWYHVMCHTYGTWLPGDPRGFRTRHHREHVEGDYKNPPTPGQYERLLERSKQLMKREPVFLTVEQRRRAVDMIAESLLKRDIELLIAAVDRVHLHLLARFPDYNPRHWVGLAKKESSAYMKQEGLAPIGGLWATRCKAEPIKDRAHQLNTFRYLLEHRLKGAEIWRFDQTSTALPFSEPS